MLIQDFLHVIEKCFDYLFKEQGFKIVYTKEYYPDRHDIGIESGFFRILFEQEKDRSSIFVGTLDSPFEDDNQDWVSIYNLMSFILNKDPDWSILDRHPYSEQIALIFSITSQQFKPLVSQIASMFNPSSKLDEWMPLFKAHVKEKVKKRFA